MENKTKAIISIVVILLIIVGAGVYVSQKSKSVATQNIAPIQTVDQTVQKPVEQQAKPQDQTAQTTTIVGKVHSMNDKQIYLDLSDGKGSATDISATTPVKTQGDDKVGNLSILKIGDSVSIKVAADNSAQEILITK